MRDAETTLDCDATRLTSKVRAQAEAQQGSWAYVSDFVVARRAQLARGAVAEAQAELRRCVRARERKGV